MHLKTCRLAAAGVVLLGLSSGTHGALLVNDRWADGTDSDPASPTYSEMGVDGDLDTDLESAWFQGGGGTLDPAAAGGPLSGSVSTGSSSWTTYFTPEASPVTLSSAGQQLKVTWGFTPRTVNGGNTSQDFRLAVVDSPAAQRLAANGAPGSGAYSGYAMFMNMAPTLGNSNPYQLREHDGNGAILGTSGDWLALANGVATGAAGYASDTQYTYVLTLTRNGASGLDIVSTMSGTAAAAEIHIRRVKSVNSSLGSSEGTIGSSAMPQIGHDPGASRTISGCIGQVYWTLAGAAFFCPVARPEA